MLCDAVQGLRPRRRFPTGPTWSRSRRTRSTAPRASARCGCATAPSPRRCSTAAGRSGAALGHAVAGAVRRLRRGGQARRRAREPRLRPCPAAVDRGASMRSARAGRSTAARGTAIAAISTSAATGVDAARLIADLRDIAFSLGSACASGSGRPSHVLRALGLELSRGALVDPARLRPLHDAGRSWSTPAAGSPPRREAQEHLAA